MNGVHGIDKYGAKRYLSYTYMLVSSVSGIGMVMKQYGIRPAPFFIRDSNKPYGQGIIRVRDGIYHQRHFANAICMASELCLFDATETSPAASSLEVIPHVLACPSSMNGIGIREIGSGSLFYSPNFFGVPFFRWSE